MTTDKDNLSTQNQPKGSARNLSDTLDRRDEDVAPGQRQWSEDSREPPARDEDAEAAFKAERDAEPTDEEMRSK
ncbi:hypothetical protein [Sphingomonas sp.]|uniref:hypothetical protein n=1 Tax=Sphingomonas sp. TaxID=28214 RepID=UPI003B3AB7D2